MADLTFQYMDNNGQNVDGVVVGVPEPSTFGLITILLCGVTLSGKRKGHRTERVNGSPQI